MDTVPDVSQLHGQCLDLFRQRVVLASVLFGLTRRTGTCAVRETGTGFVKASPATQSRPPTPRASAHVRGRGGLVFVPASLPKKQGHGSGRAVRVQAPASSSRAGRPPRPPRLNRVVPNLVLLRLKYLTQGDRKTLFASSIHGLLLSNCSWVHWGPCKERGSVEHRNRVAREAMAAEGAGDGSAVERTGGSSRGARFDSQHPGSGSQTSVSSSSRRPEALHLLFLASAPDTQAKHVHA